MHLSSEGLRPKLFALSSLYRRPNCMFKSRESSGETARSFL